MSKKSRSQFFSLLGLSLAIVPLTLASCSSITTDSKQISTPNAEVKVVEVPTVNQDIAAAKIISQKSTADSSSNWKTSYAVFPNHQKYNQAIDKLGKSLVQEVNNVSYTELSLQHSFPVAVDNTFAERLLLNVKTATNSTDEKNDKSQKPASSTHNIEKSATIYTFVDNDEIVNSADLIEKSKLTDATRALYQGLSKAKILDLDKVRALTSSNTAKESPDLSSSKKAAETVSGSPIYFQDVILNPAGGGIVTLPSGLVTSEKKGMVALQIPESILTPLLSKNGKKIQEQLKTEKSLADFKTADTELKYQPIEPVSQEKVDCSKTKCVALTYDDGPGPLTPRLLDTLKKENVKATFLTVGKQVQAYPQIFEREVREGHAVGCHTWDHPQLTKLSATAVDTQIDRTLQVMKQAGKDIEINFTRPPYGAFNPNVTATLKNKNQALILWDIDTLDWKHRDPEKTYQAALQSKSGSIILMHDIHSASIDSTERIINSLRERGFTFVTIPQMFNYDLQPGKKYFDFNLVK